MELALRQTTELQLRSFRHFSGHLGIPHPLLAVEVVDHLDRSSHVGRELWPSSTSGRMSVDEASLAVPLAADGLVSDPMMPPFVIIPSRRKSTSKKATKKTVKKAAKKIAEKSAKKSARKASAKKAATKTTKKAATQSAAKKSQKAAKKFSVRSAKKAKRKSKKSGF